MFRIIYYPAYTRFVFFNDTESNSAWDVPSCRASGVYMNRNSWAPFYHSISLVGLGACSFTEQPAIFLPDSDFFSVPTHKSALVPYSDSFAIPSYFISSSKVKVCLVIEGPLFQRGLESNFHSLSLYITPYLVTWFSWKWFSVSRDAHPLF